MALTNLTRTYYYQGELLTLSDFIREQQYVRDLVAYQNSQLFTPGVVQGLSLSASGTVLTVSAGMAFDGNGVPLFVVQDTQVDLSTKGLSAGTYPVAVQYADNASNTSSLQQSHALIEQPSVVVQTPAPSTAVVLGTVAVAAGGQISSVDMGASSKRQQSSLKLAATGAPATLAAAAAPAGQSFQGPLSVGGDAAGADTQLLVSRDLSGGAAGASTARFDFTEGAEKGSGVSLNVKKADGSHALVSARYGGNEVWELGQDGTARTLSDASLKADIHPLSGALERVAALRPVSFVWRSEPQGPRRLGLLAQEVAEVLPEVVSTNARGQRTLAYQELVPVLLQAVRELREQVAGLEARLAGGGGER